MTKKTAFVCSSYVSCDMFYLWNYLFPLWFYRKIAGESGWLGGTWLEFLIWRVICCVWISHSQWEMYVLYKHFAFFRLFTVFSGLAVGINLTLVPTCRHLSENVLMSFHHCFGIFWAKCWRKCSNYSPINLNLDRFLETHCFLVMVS